MEGSTRGAEGLISGEQPQTRGNGGSCVGEAQLGH